MAEIYERGIDVSRYQGTINWNRVKAAGYQFAIVRIGSTNSSGVYIDPYFIQNVNGARAAGLKVGAYYYTYATSKEQALNELDAMLGALEGQRLEYPVFVDAEDSRLASLGKQRATDIVEYGLTILDQKKWYAGLYTYTNFALNSLDMTRLSAWPLFIADYRGYVGYPGVYTMWQYSSTGKVDGIGGNVDLDYSYVDFLPVIRAGGYNGYEPGPVMIPLEDTRLEVFGERNTEYFSKPDVYDVVGSLENGFYPALAVSDGEYNGFVWVQFSLAGAVYWTVLLPDRTRLIRPEETCAQQVARLTRELAETQSRLEAADRRAAEAAAALRLIADDLEGG